MQESPRTKSVSCRSVRTSFEEIYLEQYQSKITFYVALSRFSLITDELRVERSYDTQMEAIRRRIFAPVVPVISSPEFALALHSTLKQIQLEMSITSLDLGAYRLIWTLRDDG